MEPYEIFTFIICLAALFAYVNLRFIKLSPTIGMMVASVVFSILLIISSNLFPTQAKPIVEVITTLNFKDILLKVMLGFLLFAGSMHIDYQSLRQERWPILTLATLGIFISTFFIGTAAYYILPIFGLHVAYVYCLLFASLISPTDPIAVLAILKTTGLPKSLELKISGESLFNDGVAVVLFLTLFEAATAGSDKVTFQFISTLFLQEAVGGIVWGLLLGYSGYWANKSIDKYEVEVMVTLATVMGGYLLAEKLHVSGPLAMVVAGIVIGNKSRGPSVSDITRDYLFKFWELIDEILNAILFMLVGFEMLTIQYSSKLFVVSLVFILVVLLARFISVSIPVVLLKRVVRITKTEVAILSWGGLRGGLSIALALSLAPDMHRETFVFITFVVVVFSIIVQGLTIEGFYKRLVSREQKRNTKL